MLRTVWRKMSVTTSSWVGPNTMSRSWRSAKRSISRRNRHSARFAPQLRRLHAGHEDFLAPRRVHLVAHDAFDIAQHGVAEGQQLYMPALDWRIIPARSISRCDAVCASAGVSFSVGRK